MITRKLEPEAWQEYMDRASRKLTGGRAEIEIFGEDLGAQVHSDLNLLGLSYDPHDRALTISGEPMEHRISDPQEIYVEEDSGELACLEVVDPEGHRQLVRVFPAPPLPP